ncbi:EpsG family protein [Wenzhouxiangella marina]|uniref:Uncharacterized protein n=1 Tax=Wenzhouxiangella marina TaxID=1579979 RepID=A0A0K0XYI8_9GAMM|nr:EpsG family protein [Wenzhouxiangella marina]AKS42753.1 hypothetical protein WM2015_2391 [Wenzhouxiangella marina]MBB6087571.1 hypothetical protein [Wenzhouxiangella marina]
MATYLVLFWTSALAALQIRRKRSARIALWVMVAVLVFFAGTRFEVGCDYTGYLLRFENFYLEETWTSLLSEAESGFHLLNFALIEGGFDYEALILVSSVIYLLCLLRFSKLSERPLDVLVLMFPILVVQLGMSGLRQALALGFLLLSLAAFVEKRTFVSAFWILFGSFFHASVLIFLPIALLARREISFVRLSAAILVLGPIAAFLMGERVELYEARYIEQEFGENSSSGAWFRYAIAIVPFVVFEWKRKLVERNHPRLYPLLRLFSLIAFSLPLVGLISSVALHRLGFYVMPVSILTLVCIAHSVFAPGSRKIAVFLPFLAYGLYLFVWFSQSRHAASCYVPYQSWMI